MDHQEITTIGDPKEMIHIFQDMHELDISTNQIRLWSDIFEILECSPQLQSLNLSYNPLQDSPFFFELEENDDDTSNQQSDSPSNSSPSPSEYTNNSNSNPADINLLAEISFSEEDRNENVSFILIFIIYYFLSAVENQKYSIYEEFLSFIILV